MRIAILGQDRRYQCLRELLRRAGVDLSGPAEADWVVTPWPAPVDLSEGTRLVTCGPAAGPSGAMDLLRDEEYQGEIARMTAEGAIFAAMAAGEGRLEGAHRPGADGEAGGAGGPGDGADPAEERLRRNSADGRHSPAHGAGGAGAGGKEISLFHRPGHDLRRPGPDPCPEGRANY